MEKEKAPGLGVGTEAFGCLGAAFTSHFLKHQNCDGRTAVHIAALNSSNVGEIQEMLGGLSSQQLIEVLKIPDTTSQRATALHYAAMRKDSDIAMYILDHLTPEQRMMMLKVQDGQGCTPLHCIAREGRADVARSMLSYLMPAQRSELLEVTNGKGQTPMDVEGNEMVADIFKDCGTAQKESFAGMMRNEGYYDISTVVDMANMVLLMIALAMIKGNVLASLGGFLTVATVMLQLICVMVNIQYLKPTEIQLMACRSSSRGRIRKWTDDLCFHTVLFGILLCLTILLFLFLSHHENPEKNLAGDLPLTDDSSNGLKFQSGNISHFATAQELKDVVLSGVMNNHTRVHWRNGSTTGHFRSGVSTCQCCGVIVLRGRIFRFDEKSGRLCEDECPGVHWRNGSTTGHFRSVYRLRSSTPWSVGWPITADGVVNAAGLQIWPQDVSTCLRICDEFTSVRTCVEFISVWISNVPTSLRKTLGWCDKCYDKLPGWSDRQHGGPDRHHGGPDRPREGESY